MRLIPLHNYVLRYAIISGSVDDQQEIFQCFIFIGSYINLDSNLYQFVLEATLISIGIIFYK
jgi:hypothetical protein